MELYTQEQMIRFLYKETNAEETAAMQAALETNWALRERFEALKSSVEGLNKVSYSPRESAIQSILNYAGLSKEVEQH